MSVADRIVRRWLARTPSPYLGELDAIAARTRISGVYAINLSYEYSCTTLARADGPGLAPTLRRTLDWPFLGLGRAAIVAHRAGPAGPFFDVTWPGAVGTLTAIAPGRFAAAINQPQLALRFQQVRDNFPTPEDINDDSLTAPSKRIRAAFPQYSKVLHGTVAAQAIGVATMRQECPHFREWLDHLAALQPL